MRCVMTKFGVRWSGISAGVLSLMMLLGLLLTPPMVRAQDAAANSEAGTRQYAAAVALHNRELYDLAAAEWLKFVTMYPKHERAGHGYHYLGICNFKNRAFDKAVANFQQVLEKHPKFDKLESTYLYLGITQFSQGQAGDKEAFAAAEKTFGDQVAKFPKGDYVPQALYYRGESFYALDNREHAIPMYQALVTQYPKHALVTDALYALGVAQEELKQFEAADKTYTQFLAAAPDNALATEVVMRRGETLFAREQFAEADKLFGQAAAAKDFALADHATVRQAAAKAARQQYAEAATLYASVPVKWPESTNVTVAQLEGGKCAYLAGQFDQTRKLLAPIQTQPGAVGAEASHWIARSHLRESQFAEALKVADAALPGAKDTPMVPQLLLDKADALYDLPKRRADAVPVYVELATKYPEDPSAQQALYMAGFAALDLGKFDEALAHSDAFLKKYTDSTLTADVVYVAAEARLQKAQYGTSGDLYQQLLTKFADHQDADQWKVRLGLSRQLDKKFAEAVAALTPLVAGITDKALLAEAEYLIGSSQLQLGKTAEAAAALEKSVAADATWRQADETLLALADAYRRSDQVDKATAQLKTLITKFPESDQLDRAHYRLGEYAYSQQKFPEAITEYDLVVKNWPESKVVPAALYGLGWAQLSQSKYDAAVAPLTQLVDKFPEDPLTPRGRYARALAEQQLKKFAEAQADLTAFVTALPEAEEVWDAKYVMGLCQVGLDKQAEAAATFESILKDNPEYPGGDKVRYELAWALKAQDQHDKAVDVFAALAEKHPESTYAPESLYHVGEKLYADEKFPEAATKYAAAVAKANGAGVGEKAQHKQGWALYRSGKLPEAEAAFAAQVEKFPAGELLADARFMQAESLFEQKKYKEALALYAQVKNPTATDADVLSVLHAAQSANQTEQYEPALALITDFAKKFPESPLIPEALYEQAFATQRLGKLDEAIALYEQVTAKTDREIAARARFMVGEAFFEKKDHAEAVRNFFKVAYGYSYPTWQANAQYEAGRCFEILKKTEQALKSYKEVVTKFPDSDKAKLAQERVAALGG